MEVNASEEKGVTTICLVGELDTAAVNQVKPQFDEFIAAPDKDYRIDCSKLSYIASAGLRLLLALRKACRTTGRNVVLTVILFLAVLISCSTGNRQETISSAAEQFSNPPRVARPYVWWHWMFGYVSQEGILKDLSWMDRAGIAGFHQFDAGGMGMAKAANVQYPYFSDGWKEMFRYALHVADSLGMDVTIASAPGWSSTGGRWVTPQDAMKKLEWRCVETDGGEINIKLPHLHRTVGQFQDWYQPNDRIQVEPYGEDLAVLAVKMREDDFSAKGRVVNDSTVIFRFDREVTARAITVQSYRMAGRPLGKPEASGNISPYEGFSVNTLEASSDGRQWTPVRHLSPTELPYLTENFNAVTARHFRVRGQKLKGAVLYGANRIEHSEEQGAFTNPKDLHRFHTPEAPDSTAVQQVIDLTGQMTTNGQLMTVLPSGRWRIYRFGWSITGKVNHPANPEATGLEVDKLDPDAWTNYFRTYLNMYREAAGDRMGHEGIQRLLIDSYEAGSQTWTPKMEEEFAARRGYELRGWLPVLTGEIIGSAAESEGFLWDWRKTIAELYEENYDRIDGIIAEYGLRGRYTESHEGGRAFCGDGMKVKRNAEIPMSAIWTHDTPEGSRIPAAISDIRESASVAHLYGHPIVAAESFTVEGSHQKAYTYTPEKLKYTADVALSAGLNRFVIHESAAQPGEDFLPGVGLFRYGQWFTRHETWAEWAHPWTDYLARSCWMLQLGHPVADILCYYGEDSNATSQWGGASFNGLFQVPEGYEYDYIDPWSLLHTVSTSHGKLVTGSEMSYGVLCLSDDCTTMSMEILERLKEFADAGVVICGAAPVRCAGLLADDLMFNSLVSDIWNPARGNVVSTLSEAITAAALSPDFVCTSFHSRYVHHVMKDADIWWLRNFDGTETDGECQDSPSGNIQQMWSTSDCHPDTSSTVSFRCRRHYAYIFDPEDGSITDWSDRLSHNGSRCSLPLRLVPGKAVFAVLSDRKIKSANPRKTFTPSGTYDITGPWSVNFAQKGGSTAHLDLDTLSSWTLSSDPVIKYYSGIAEYTTTINIVEDGEPASPGCFISAKTGGTSPAIPESPVSGKVIIDLGEVRELAQVLINGKDAGILWHHPFVTGDISGLLHEGENILTVRVANTWVNRMIGDKQPGVTNPVTRVVRFYGADDTLLTSGLLGPVRVISGTRSIEYQ